MISKNVMRIVFATLVVCCICTAQTLADTVSVSTGVANWTIDSFTQASGGPATAYGPPSFGNSAPVITAHPGWTGGPQVQAHDASARWIGPTADSNTLGSYGYYTYKLELTVPPLLANTTYELNGWFSSDNLVDTFTLNGNPLAITSVAGQTIYGFQSAFTVGPDTGVSPITLMVRVYNESTIGDPPGPSGPFSNENPTGLIIAGNVTAVPLPAPVLAGGALMGLMGLAKVVRRARLQLN